MSYLGSALGDVLHTLDWEQKKLAEKSGVTRAQINRYIRGKVPSIPPDSMARVLAAIPQSHHRKLLVGYLRDCIPMGYEPLVEIYGAASGVAEVPPSGLLLPTIDKELDGILRSYANLAMRHTEVRDMLKTFLSALGIRPDISGA